MWSRRRSSKSQRYSGFSPWPEYVSVGQRKVNAAAQVAKMAKNGHKVAPVVIEGRAIATTVWGKAWCAALEAQADLASRLPRGRSYVRHNCVIDLSLQGREVRALVQGSELYHARIDFTQLPAARWKTIVQACSGKIGSMIELLQGKISRSVMDVVADPKDGLFPRHGEMKLSCSCPDDAWMCKHLAAVLYAIGNRLDKQPELLFPLRGVDASELLTSTPAVTPTSGYQVLDGDLSDIFGVDLDGDASPISELPPSSILAPSARRSAAKKPAVKKPAAKDSPEKKPAAAKTKASAAKKPAAKSSTKKAPATSAPKTSNPDRSRATTTPATKKPATKKPATKKASKPASTSKPAKKTKKVKKDVEPVKKWSWSFLVSRSARAVAASGAHGLDVALLW